MCEKEFETHGCEVDMTAHSKCSKCPPRSHQLGHAAVVGLICAQITAVACAKNDKEEF